MSEDDIKKLDAVLRSDELSALLTQPNSPFPETADPKPAVDSPFSPKSALSGLVDGAKSSPYQSELERSIEESICTILGEESEMDEDAGGGKAEAETPAAPEATAHDDEAPDMSHDMSHDLSHDMSHDMMKSNDFDIDMATLQNSSMILNVSARIRRGYLDRVRSIVT